MSQPAVSMQIKQLGDNVGLALFEQLGKRIFLTQAGQEVYDYSRAINQQLTEMETVLNLLKGVTGGKLNVSVISTANYFIPALLAVFNQRFSNIEISLDVTNRETLLQHLNKNTVDLVVMGQPPAELDVEAGAFMDNPLVIVAPPDHPLATQKHIPLKRLQDEVFLVREQGSGTRIAMERFFGEKGIRIKTGMEVGSNEAIKQSVQAGLGLGLLSYDTLEQELSLKRLVILDVAEFPIMRHWYVVHRRGKRLPPVAQAFKEFVLEEAGSLLRSDRANKGQQNRKGGLRRPERN